MFRLFFIFCAVFLAACSTTSRSTDLKIHEINALSSLNSGDGNFQGMEFLADPLPGKLKNRVNIFYVHGIGWTENPDGDPLANDFLAGVADAYNIQLNDLTIKSHCGDEDHEKSTAQTASDYISNSEHVFITANDKISFETALTGSRLEVDRLICMDKTVLPVDDILEFAVYRVFWDDLFWNALQFPHVGQDDDAGSSKAIAGLRRKYNRKLKDELVNYGFSDAVMYLGPAGHELRRAVQGAMCSAALDASDYSFEKQGHEISYGDVCNLASYKDIKTNQFAFVTESLGSKITYDVMRESLSDGIDNALDDMIKGSEFYMLANQVALLSLNDLSTGEKMPVKTFAGKDRPKIIALSELNDFLTYELIPFYQQLWSRSVRRPVQTTSEFGTRFAAAPESDTQAARDAIVNSVGFDIVDIRLEFADRLVPLLDSFVDPLQAHGGHASEPELMLLMLCGAVDGKLNDDACLATEIAKEKAK